MRVALEDMPYFPAVIASLMSGTASPFMWIWAGFLFFFFLLSLIQSLINV